MKHISRAALAGAAVMALAFGATAITPSFAKEMTKMVGGAAMYPSKNIVENAVHSKDHTTLVAAVKAAGLVDTLESPGPFTVFAPTNEAFGRLPKGTVANLGKPENKATLTKILTYPGVPGRYTAKDLMNMAREGGGHASLKTADGEMLTITPDASGRSLYVDDMK